ncbi:hypothetical protein [Ornithinibacillus gellani]|nr:hypothetical protein [Ornithinibacillus gellani]
MQNSSTHSLVEELKVEEQKREAFLDHLASIIESTLSKSDVTDNEKNR